MPCRLEKIYQYPYKAQQIYSFLTSKQSKATF